MAFSVVAHAQTQQGETIQSALNAIVSGDDVSGVEGVAVVSTSTAEMLASLAGCAPSLADGSSRQFVNFQFVCEGTAALPKMRSVIFRYDGDEMEGVHVTDWRAVGPTATARETSDLPSRNRHMSSLTDAVIKGGDVTLAGLIPLTTEQVSDLQSLASCNWKKLRQSSQSQRTSMVQCDNDAATLITMRFDDLGRTTWLEIERGSVVRRRVR